MAPDDQVDPIRSPAPKRRGLGLHDRALGLLAVRMRSRRELQRRLLQAGFDPDEIEDELVRLEDVGLVDDEAFADAFTEQALTARKGPRAIASGLYEKGIDRSTIDRVLSGCTEGQMDRAVAFAEARAGRLRDVPAPKAFQRLSSALMRRGFDPETARSAARAVLDTQDAEAG